MDKYTVFVAYSLERNNYTEKPNLKSTHKLFNTPEEAKEATRILEHRGVDTSLDDTSCCVAVYDVDDFNIDTVGKDFELTICF